MTGLKMKYFVLKPSFEDEYGKASIDAMLCYADKIAPVDAALAADLREWVLSVCATPAPVKRCRWATLQTEHGKFYVRGCNNTRLSFVLAAMKAHVICDCGLPIEVAEEGT